VAIDVAATGVSFADLLQTTGSTRRRRSFSNTFGMDAAASTTGLMLAAEIPGCSLYPVGDNAPDPDRLCLMQAALSSRKKWCPRGGSPAGHPAAGLYKLDSQ
jgi:hypothetical protein